MAQPAGLSRRIEALLPLQCGWAATGSMRIVSRWPLGITQVQWASHIGVPIQRVDELVRGKRGVSPETVWLLGKAMNTSPEFWLNLQAACDLARSRPHRVTRPMSEVS